MARDWVIPLLPEPDYKCLDDEEAFKEWQARYAPFMHHISPQLKPGAVVTYPDGSKYKASWKPVSSYVCGATGRHDVYELTRIMSPEEQATSARLRRQAMRES